MELDALNYPDIGEGKKYRFTLVFIRKWGERALGLEEGLYEHTKGVLEGLLKRMCRSTEAFTENGESEKPMENYTREIEGK